MELFFVNYTEVYCPICAYKCQYYSVIIWGVKGVCLLSTFLLSYKPISSLVLELQLDFAAKHWFASPGKFRFLGYSSRV